MLFTIMVIAGGGPYCIKLDDPMKNGENDAGQWNYLPLDQGL